MDKSEARKAQADEESPAQRQAKRPAARKPAAPSPRRGSSAKGDEEPLYTIGSWRRHTQWRCRLCPWDTLDGEEAMLAHLATRHAPLKPQVLVADKSGKPINE